MFCVAGNDTIINITSIAINIHIIMVFRLVFFFRKGIFSPFGWFVLLYSIKTCYENARCRNYYQWRGDCGK